MMEEQRKEVQQNAPSHEDNKARQMRDNVMRVALTSEARQRLTNVRMVKPDVAQAIEEYIIKLVTSGRLKRTIDDEQLKELLTTIQGQGKREFKIRRI